MTVPVSAVALATRYTPDALAFEAFALGPSTNLLDPLEATTLDDALAETTARWSWDRGARIGIREIGAKVDKLHVYAVRKASVGRRVWNGHVPSVHHTRWLDHICTVDLDVVAGIGVNLLGFEHDLHLRRQHQRPEGARMERDAL